MTKIPDSWLEYKPIGKEIEDTRFICFKVPLEEAVNFENNVAPNERLYSKLLLEKVPNLGLVIDLTFTAKYYDPHRNFIDKGIEYHKIYVRGHGIPSEKACEEFKDIVTKFLEKNRDNDKLIGVHCTHGINRTGFLVCHYMITTMNIQPEIALKRFEIARGHPIHRAPYVDYIKTLKADHCRRRLPSFRHHPYERRIQHQVNCSANDPIIKMNTRGYARISRVSYSSTRHSNHNSRNPHQHNRRSHSH